MRRMAAISMSFSEVWTFRCSPSKNSASNGSSDGRLGRYEDLKPTGHSYERFPMLNLIPFVVEPTCCLTANRAKIALREYNRGALHIDSGQRLGHCAAQ